MRKNLHSVFLFLILLIQPIPKFPDWIIIESHSKEVMHVHDREIIALYFQRAEDAITQTDIKYGNYCFSIARNILTQPEDARESVNDTYLAAWNAIPPHKPRSLSAFLGKITRRISINRYLSATAAKRGGGEMPLALEELSDCIPSPVTVESQLEGKELSALLSRFLRNLPDTERKVFLLRYWYLESIQQIAVRFDFSESKVKSMLYRTRNKLRAELEMEGIFV